MTYKKWFVGAVLTGVMVTVLGTTAILFSARDFQHGLAQISPDTNGLVDFQKLHEADAEIARLQAETAEPRGELLSVRSQIETLDNSISRQEGEINDSRAAIAQGVAQVEANAQVAQAESAAAALDANSLNNRVLSLAGRPGLSPADQGSVATLRGQVGQLAELETNLETRDAERRALVARERAVGGQVAESDRRVFALQQSVVPNYEHYGRVKSEVNALVNMSPLGVGALAAQGHPAFVSTLLVLVMGALGAILYLFPAYLNRKEEVTFAEIFVRLIFGMCAALAFYMLANATIAGFSVSSGVQQATTSATLNPFTVSLIGIIAGVMAEDIAKWIQDRGKGIFTQGVQAPTTDAAAAAAAPPLPPIDPGYEGINPHGGPNAP
jgi:hypothetical protein